MPNSANADTCQQCEDASPEFDRAVAAVDYAGPWPDLIARLKFRSHTGVADQLGKLLCRAIHARGGLTADLIVPVPLSAQRLRQRGFNQAWLLTQRVATRLHIQARHDVLVRSRHTDRLMHLNAEARAEHISQAFDVPSLGTSCVAGRHIALVDDVMTTGATLNAAAAALFDAGAASVSAWVVARTPLPAF